MSDIQILVPDLGDDGAAEVIEILFKEGDAVQAEDIVVVLESDKATMEIPCEQSGVLSSLERSLGDEVRSGDLIATLSADLSEESEGAEEKAASSETQSEPVEETEANNETNEQAAQEKEQAVERLEIEEVPDTGSEGESELIEISCKVGDQVSAGDILFVLESDKATMEFPATFNGEVTQVFVSLGDQLKMGDRLCELKTSDAATGGGDSNSDSGQHESKPAASSASAKPAPAAQAQKQVQQPQVSNYRNPNVHAGPAARRLARELGVDLSLVKPSGPKDRILKDDIKAFVRANLNKGGGGSSLDLELPDIDFAKFGEIEKQKLTRIKKVSAKNLHRSWLTIPHVTQFDEADITNLEAFRKSEGAVLKDQGIKLTPLAFLVKASAMALKEFPRFNASLDKSGEQLVLKKYFNIGVAVDTPDGLVVPVVKEADQKSITDIAKELGEISEKARAKKLMPQDMQGACFSISSLGGIGGTAFTPIVNWPEVGILGVSRSQMKPVYDGENFVPRLMLPLSLSYDHRVIDGAEAARFSRYFAELLADESLLTL